MRTLLAFSVALGAFVDLGALRTNLMVPLNLPPTPYSFFHPVTSVVIIYCPDFSRGAVNVATHHALNGIGLRIANGCFFEVADKIEDVLDATFY